MPQLSIETFVSQYFWFISILLIFYFIAITQVIPRIAEIMKTRLKTSQPTLISDTSVKGSTDSKRESDSTFTIFSNISKNITLNDEASHNSSSSDSEITLKKASELWVRNNI